MAQEKKLRGSPQNTKARISRGIAKISKIKGKAKQVEVASSLDTNFSESVGSRPSGGVSIMGSTTEDI
jgi:hypothetical protein